MSLHSRLAKLEGARAVRAVTGPYTADWKAVHCPLPFDREGFAATFAEIVAELTDEQRQAWADEYRRLVAS